VLFFLFGASALAANSRRVGSDASLTCRHAHYLFSDAISFMFKRIVDLSKNQRGLHERPQSGGFGAAWPKYRDSAWVLEVSDRALQSFPAARFALAAWPGRAAAGAFALQQVPPRWCKRRGRGG
jgi:hypothetical protein